MDYRWNRLSLLYLLALFRGHGIHFGSSCCNANNPIVPGCCLPQEACNSWHVKSAVAIHARFTANCTSPAAVRHCHDLSGPPASRRLGPQCHDERHEGRHPKRHIVMASMKCIHTAVVSDGRPSDCCEWCFRKGKTRWAGCAMTSAAWVFFPFLLSYLSDNYMFCVPPAGQY